MHGEDQAHQPEVMIAMQVTDEDPLDAVNAQSEFDELHLGSFATVDQEILILNSEMLGRWKPAIGRQRSAGTQDC